MVSQQATEVLNTLSSILTITNAVKFRIQKEQAARGREDEEKPVEEEKPIENKPTESEEKPVEEETKPTDSEEKPTEEETKPQPAEAPSTSVEIKLRGSVEDDLDRLSSLLSHAVTQQFSVLARIRKFMDNVVSLFPLHTQVDKEALGRSREFEQAHAMPTTIRESLVQQNEEMSHMLADATQNLTVNQTAPESRPRQSVALRGGG